MTNPFENFFKKEPKKSEQTIRTQENEIEYNNLPDAVKKQFEKVSAKYRKHDDLGVFGIEHITITVLEGGNIEYQIDGNVSIKLAEKDEQGKNRFNIKTKTFTINTHNGQVIASTESD